MCFHLNSFYKLNKYYISCKFNFSVIVLIFNKTVYIILSNSSYKAINIIKVEKHVIHNYNYYLFVL